MKEYYVAVFGDQEEYGDFDSRDGWRLKELAEQLVRRLKLTTPRKCPQQVFVTIFKLKTKDGKLDRHKIQTFDIMPCIESITKDEFNQELAEILTGRAPTQRTEDLLRECREHERGKSMAENVNNEPTQSIEDAIRECDAHADYYNRRAKIADLVKDLTVDDTQKIFDIIIQILGDPAKGVTMPSAGTEAINIPQFKVVSKPVVTVQSVVEIIEKIGSKTTAELKDTQRKFIDRGDIRSASLIEYRFSGFSDFKAALLEALAEIK